MQSHLFCLFNVFQWENRTLFYVLHSQVTFLIPSIPSESWISYFSSSVLFLSHSLEYSNIWHKSFECNHSEKYKVRNAHLMKDERNPLRFFSLFLFSLSSISLSNYLWFVCLSFKNCNYRYKSFDDRTRVLNRENLGSGPTQKQTLLEHTSIKLITTM